ncbi:LOW QUALITY PROTEIN: hypothetical protein HZS_5 [Henneguya salminicola]|nr:LOW QUALITY PROTEIN: hypothetical protein HZS_5 [Henneguya salminicola]
MAKLGAKSDQDILERITDTETIIARDAMNFVKKKQNTERFNQPNPFHNKYCSAYSHTTEECFGRPKKIPKNHQ